MKFKNILAFSIGPVASAFLAFITLPLITWLYTPEDIGRASMLLVLSSFSVLFFSLGLDQAYVREYNEYENKPRLFKVAIFPSFLLISIVAMFFLINRSLLSELLFDVSKSIYSQIIVLYISSSLVSRFLSLILRMEQRGIAYSTSQILPKIIFLLSILSIYILDVEAEFIYLLCAHLLSIVSVMLILLFNTHNTWLKSMEFKIDWPLEKEMLRFGMPLILGGVAYWGLTAIDKIFIQHYSSYEELGIYSVAISFEGVATIIQSVFSTVWVPIVYKWIADGEDLTKVDTVREYLLMVIIFVFILAGLFSWIIGYLIPAGYERVPYMLVVCLAAPLFYTLSETTVVGLGVTRNSKLSMLASILAFIFNIIGNYLLVPQYGSEGAAISTAISFWLFFVLRTEFAIYAWQSIERFKLYSLTVLVLFSSISFMIYGQDFFSIFIFIWLSILLILLLVSQKILNNTFIFIKNKFSSRKDYL